MTMTIPTLPSMPAGYVVQAADMNNLSYAATFLLTTPIVHVQDGLGTQSVLTSFVSIAFNTKSMDTDGMWSSGATSLLTIQTPGFYKVSYCTDAVAASTAYTNQSVVQVVTGANNPLGAGVSLAECIAGYGAALTASSLRVPTHGVGIIPYYLYALDTVALQIKAAGTGMTLSTYVPSSLALEFVSA